VLPQKVKVQSSIEPQMCRELANCRFIERG